MDNYDSLLSSVQNFYSTGSPSGYLSDDVDVPMQDSGDFSPIPDAGQATTSRRTDRFSDVDFNLASATAVHFPEYGPVPVDFSPCTTDVGEAPFWCSISYSELKIRIGEPFHASRDVQSVIVDGGCAPSDATRFCLGVLSNVNRSKEVVETRKHIGRGARFYRIGDSVYVECLSDSPIFVQSPSANRLNNMHLKTVCKVFPGCNLKIFEAADFIRLVQANIPYGFDAVYPLRCMCVCRISFVKGWGEAYRRKEVTAVPTWIEVQLNTFLPWLDRVLSQTGGPQQNLDSK